MRSRLSGASPRPRFSRMPSSARIGRLALLAALAVGFVAAPALAQLDTYRCAAMGTTHFCRCCASAHAEASRSTEWRSEPRQCCELEAEGTEAPSSATSSPAPLVGAPAAAGLLLAAVTPPAQMRVRPLVTRSRAPPIARLFVQHSSFLL